MKRKEKRRRGREESEERKERKGRKQREERKEKKSRKQMRRKRTTYFFCTGARLDRRCQSLSTSSCRRSGTNVEKEKDEERISML